MPRRRSVADRERDNQAVELRRRGLNHRQIATQLGYRSPSSAYDAITRAIRDQSKEMVGEVRQMELDRLDDMARIAWRVVAREHISVSQGRAVVHPVTGDVLTDDMPKLHALDRLLKISERRAKLLGLDAPVQAKVEIQDGLDAEIERLVAELARSGAGAETTPEGPPGGRARVASSSRAQAVAGDGKAEATSA